MLKAAGYSAMQWLTNLFLGIGKRFLPFYKRKVANVTARKIVVSLCSLARVNCLHMSYWPESKTS